MEKKIKAAAETETEVKTKLVSSNLAEMRYSKETQILKVFFKNGTGYKYFPVPEEVHAQFGKAESAGQFFHKYIKGVFKFEKLVIPPEPKGQL